MPTDLEHLLVLAGASARYADQSWEAIQPIGTVNSRKDGDWIKTEKGWVRVTKDLKATIGPVPAGKPTSKAKKPSTAPSAAPPAPLPPVTAPAPASAQTATARAKAALKKTASVFDKNPDAKVSVGHMMAMPTPKPAAPAAPPPAPAAPPAPAQDIEAKRAELTKKITPLLLKTLKSIGDSSDDEVVVYGKTLTASYRTWNLPKDPPDDPSDYDEDDDTDSYDGGGDYYQYEEDVTKELKNARTQIAAALHAHMDGVAKIRASMGDKNYVEVEVELK